MFKKLIISISLGLILSSNLYAQDESKKSSNSTLYIHPFSLILSGTPGFTWLTATYENNFTNGKSFLVRPMFMKLGKDDGISQGAIGVGLRNYMAKPNSGIYFDLVGNVGFASLEIEDDNTGESIDGSGLFFAGLGHIGAKKRWDKLSLMIDIGGGYQYIAINLEDSQGNEVEGTGGGPAFDINFGVGFHF